MYFDGTSGAVITSEGRRIDLTSYERRALELLTETPGRAHSRQELLDAISAPGSDSHDRNIDFLISRLRRKLGDDARKPRFIGTRYGEGYVWLPAAQSSTSTASAGKVILGPIIGATPDRPALIEALSRHLRGAFGEVVDLIVLPEFVPADANGLAHRHVEVVIIPGTDTPSCALSIRTLPAEILESSCRIDPDALEANETACAIRTLVDRAWLSGIRRASESQPLPVSLHLSAGEADDTDREVRVLSQLETSMARRRERSVATWDRTIARIEAILDTDTANPRLKILLAVALHSRWVTGGVKLLLDGQDTRARDEDRIETLVTDALPGLGAHSVDHVMAGKLLHYLRRGYDEQALALCEDALSRSAEVSRSLAIIGQMRAFFGRTDDALLCLRQASELVRPGSDAHLYAIVLKCQTLAAARRWDELGATLEEWSALSRISSLAARPLFCAPHAPGPMARTLVSLMTQRRASALLEFYSHVCARLFIDPAMGQNTLMPLTGLMKKRFGSKIVLPDAASSAVLR